MSHLSAEEVSRFRRNGYVVVKNLFTREQTTHLRERIEALHRRTQGTVEQNPDPLYPRASFFVGDVFGKPELADQDYVFLDRRVVAVIKSLIGEPIVYFGDSSIQIGEATRGFHKDNVDRSDAGGPDWDSEYTIVRCAFYLEDHSRHSGGLKVRVRSHNHASRHRGRSVNLSTEPGDLVVWYLRTSHSGNAVRLKGLRGLSLHPRVEGLLPRWLRAPEELERIAMFCTFGRPDHHLDRYIDYQRTRTDMPPHWRLCGSSPSLLRLAQSRGVVLRSPIPDYGADLKQWA